MKFKDVLGVSTTDGLIRISCYHEGRGTDIYDEYFFLNKEHKLVAHFKSTGVLNVEQLSENVENIFYINELEFLQGFIPVKSKKMIVKVNPDLTYDVLHNIEDYERGIEDDAFAIIKNNGLLGFMDAYGNEFIKPQYEGYSSFSQGLAGVYKNGKWGFINKQNELIIPYEYEFPENYYSQFMEYKNKLYVSVMKDGKWGIIDNHNDVIIPFKYDDIGYANKIIFARKDDKCGFIDLNDNIVVPFEYDDYEEDFCNFCELSEYHLIAKNDYIGLIDNNGNFVIPIAYKELSVTNKNVIVAKKLNNKYALINFENKQISNDFDYIDSFPNEGMYEVYNRIESKRIRGYITESGELTIPLKYLHTKRFNGGLAVVEISNFKEEVINKQGKTLYQGKNNEIFNLGNGYILAEAKENEFEIIKLLGE